MSPADACSAVVALPIAWALLALRAWLPAAPARRYRCILAQSITIPAPDEAGPGAEDAPAPQEWASGLWVASTGSHA
jgi:hypothetical protein